MYSVNMGTFRTSEVARVLRVAPYRVRELIHSGRLRAAHHPTGYYWVVEASELRRYVLSGAAARGRRRNVEVAQ